MKVPKKLHREYNIRAENINEETRTITFSVSSEEPYERWFGIEVLSHDDGAVVLERFNNGAPLLFNHGMNNHLGKIEKSYIKDKKVYIEARFGKGPLAEEKFQDVKDEILTKASIGYEYIDSLTLTEKGENGKPSKYLATKWMPYEASLVTIPADNTVGVGRANCEEIEINIIGEQKTNTEEPVNERNSIMPTENQTSIDPVKQERERMQTIQAIGEKYNQKDLARQLIENGSTVDQMRAAILDKIGTPQQPIKEHQATIGMTEKEVKNYSFLKVIRTLAYPNEAKFREDAAFELDASQAAAKLHGKAARGFLVPYDILKNQRSMNIGTSTQGGNLVATTLQSDSFIEMLRNRSALQNLGVWVLNGLVGNIEIPRQTGGGTSYWVGEDGEPTESTPAIDQVTMGPKTVGAYTDLTRKLILQSSVDVENFIKFELAKTLALAIDSKALYGTGNSYQPLGIKLTTGINTKDLGTANTPSFAEIVDMETLIAADNADIGTLAYLTNATIRGKMKSTPKESGQAAYIWEKDEVNGYRAACSNQVGSGDLFFGNWADLIIGMWSGLDLTVDPYAKSKSGGVRVIALQDLDVAVRHPESFCCANATY